jgi:uncharacterized phiE125 gp8 family phage protein
MNLTTIVKPPYGAVPLSAVWLHLRLDADGSPLATALDDALERNIITATAEFEAATRSAVIEQTLRLSVGSVSDTGIDLPRPPLIRVNSVSYYDSTNILQTVASADYYVTDDFPPRLRFVTGWVAPTLYDRPDAIRVEYVVGYRGDGSPTDTEAEYQANVPKQIQDAVLIYVEMLQANTSPADREALEKAFKCIASSFEVPLSQT